MSPMSSVGVMLPLAIMFGWKPSSPVELHTSMTAIMAIAVQLSDMDFLALRVLPVASNLLIIPVRISLNGLTVWFIVKNPIVGISVFIRAFIVHVGFGSIGDSHSKAWRVPR